MAARHLALLLLLASLGGAVPAHAALREPVHPRRNVEEFAPVEARFIRFTVRATNRGEPCLDELEIYSSDPEPRNVALASSGARATASGTLEGYAIHRLTGVNDGRYGNGRSWIADRLRGAWVQIELPQVTRIKQVVWGRDREGNFIDRLPTEYTIEVAVETNSWRTVASSADREPLTVGAQLSGLALTPPFVNRFAPVGTTLSQEAERPSTEHTIDVWQTADGLPGNTVTAIEQTADGYLWIGTLNGLARFDGMKFRVFGEGSDLPNTRVLCLLAARDGTLWIGTDGGGLVSWRDGRFRSLTANDGLRHETVLSLAEDADGSIWAGTASGLNCWSGERFVTNAATDSAPWASVTALASGRDESLWAVVGAELRMRDRTNGLQRLSTDEPSAFSSVLAVHAGRSGQVWFGNANGYLGSVSNGAVHVFGEQPGQLLGATWALCETRNGDVWAGTASGGLRRLRGGRLTSVTTQEGLSDNSVRALFEDREGNLWVGTVGGGLNRVKPRKLTTFTTRDGLAHNVTMSIAEDADGTAMWIGSNCGGISTRRDGAFAPFHASYLLDNECIWSLLPARDGSLWAGTWGGGLFRIRGREVQNFPTSASGPNDSVIALCEKEDGGLWIGTMQGGLKQFDEGRVIDSLTNGFPYPVTALLQEPGGALWAGTSGGGLKRLEEGRLVTFTRREGLPSDFVRTLYRSADGVLWVGTGGGLARLARGQLFAFTHERGLLDEVVSQILEDDRGNLWLGCNQGIFRIARAELDAVASGHAVRVNPIAYGRAEGMESLECTGGFHPAGLRSRDGKLWFSTVKGLVMVDPANITVNELAPPVVIEEVVVDGVAKSGSALKGSLRFGPGVQRAEFRFAALSLVAAERNRFRYRLEGLDHDWVEAGGQRVAAYPHLPPARYRFRVIACNNDGVWNTTGATLAFTVRPAFWQTWWFVTAVIALVLGTVGWSVRYASVRRLRRRLRLLEEKHALEKERTRIAQDLHDELGASLTRIALLTELGRKHRGQPEEVAADFGKISATARDAVRAMDAIVWAVNPHNDSLDHFANYVSQFAEEFFRPTSIRCRLDVPADLPERPLPTEARHQLFLALKESLNNVVLHSGATEVWVRLGHEGGELRMVIEDNGRGLPADAPALGHDGLGNIRSRMERMGGRVTVESGPDRGTIVRLSLPLAVPASA